MDNGRMARSPTASTGRSKTRDRRRVSPPANQKGRSSEKRCRGCSEAHLFRNSVRSAASDFGDAGVFLSPEHATPGDQDSCIFCTATRAIWENYKSTNALQASNEFSYWDATQPLSTLFLRQTWRTDETAANVLVDSPKVNARTLEMASQEMRLEVFSRLASEMSRWQNLRQKLATNAYKRYFSSEYFAQDEHWFCSARGKIPDAEKLSLQEIYFYDSILQRTSLAVDWLIENTLAWAILLGICWGWRYGVVQDLIGFVEAQ